MDVIEKQLEVNVITAQKIAKSADIIVRNTRIVPAVPYTATCDRCVAIIQWIIRHLQHSYRIRRIGNIEGIRYVINDMTGSQSRGVKVSFNNEVGNNSINPPITITKVIQIGIPLT